MFSGRLWALRRRYCSGPLVLLVVALCLFYQTLMVARSRLKSGQFAPGVRNRSTVTDPGRPSEEQLLQNPGGIVSALEALQRERGVNAAHRSRPRLAVVLTGQHAATDTEVHLYQRVLGQRGYEVSLARYAETSGALRSRHGGSDWTVLLCLSESENSCLRRVSFSRLLPQQRVNMIPGMMEAFSEAAGRCRFQTDPRLAGLPLPINPSACGPLHAQSADGGDRPAPDDWKSAAPGAPSTPFAPPGLAATVNVYVLVTSETPLTAFLHATGLVRARGESNGRTAQLTTFFLQHLGPEASHEALGHVKEVIGQVLRAAASTNEEPGSHPRCLLCFQLMTFTLRFSGSLRPVIVKAQTDLRFDGLRDPGFDGQIAKEFILEDALHFLLPPGAGATQAAGGPNTPAAKMVSPAS